MAHKSFRVGGLDLVRYAQQGKRQADCQEIPLNTSELAPATHALLLAGQHLVRTGGSSPGTASNDELLANRSMRLVDG